jgi:hypothetical protein
MWMVIQPIERGMLFLIGEVYFQIDSILRESY